MIDVTGDLLGAAARSDVLGAHERRASGLSGERDQVVGDQRHRSPRASLPRRVGGRIHDHLADHPPARVVGIAPRDEKSCERLCHPERPWLGAVAVEMA